MISSALVALYLFGGQIHPKTLVLLGGPLSQQIAKSVPQATTPVPFHVKVVLEQGGLISSASVQQVLKANPDFVLLEPGFSAVGREWPTIRDRFVPSIEANIETIRKAPSHPKVFVCLPPPVLLGSDDMRAKQLETEIVPLLKQAARETNCTILDFESALRARLDLVDGMRPTEMGAQILADTVADAVAVGRKANWRITYVDSQELDEGPAKNAIDGDVDTYWHTNYSTTSEHYPHELQIDTGSVRTIGGFSYFPRQDGVNGRVAKYEFYVSMDGKSWGEPMAIGQFRRTSDLVKVFFEKPAQGRFIRFRALSEQQGQIWASVGELDILKFYPKRH